jgi:hypothetical protein
MLQIVVPSPAALDELIQTEKEVAVGGSERGGERSPPLGRVAKSMEHGASKHGR